MPAVQPKVTELSNLSIDAQYRTGENDPVAGFYHPCLRTSTRYDRAVGYFRSSIFSIVGQAFLEFARRGGRARLVCSPSITEDDAKAIASGYVSRDQCIAQVLDRDIQELLADPSLASRTRLLATLIQCEILDLRLAVRSNAAGIYHEKIGIFTDASGQSVSFLGSANETWSAWHAQGNHESIEVFRDWVSVAENERVQKHVQHFERLWAGQVVGVETVKFPDAQRKKLLTTASSNLDDVDIGYTDDPPPAIGNKRTPLEHQTAAIAAWEAIGRHGVFEHATGSGKTFTALMAIKRHLASGQPAIVLVPSQLLLEQWRREVESEIPDVTLLICGGGHTRWNQPGTLNAQTRPGIGMNRVVLATMQTAASDAFLKGICGGDHLLLVADEVHQIGSPFNARAMTLRSGAALGLSATPVRYGDPEGTANIFERFGPVIPPPFSLQDAIKAGRLVKYEYHPHIVHLDDEEAHDWKMLSKQISFEVVRGNRSSQDNLSLSEKAKMLLIKRSRIAKKARAKPGLAAATIAREFEEGQRWLVYCEDSKQLAKTKTLLSERGLNPVEYHTGMIGERSAAIDWFTKFGGVLVSIKCLDEGIDIPAVSHAFILASSQNPRQFIQRRGRVLRKYGDKQLAVIHDAIVAPVDAQDEPEQIALLKSELARALQFANSAINASSGASLRALAIGMGIDVESFSSAGIEDSDEGESKDGN